jgi:hypothetical protein
MVFRAWVCCVCVCVCGGGGGAVQLAEDAWDCSPRTLLHRGTKPLPVRTYMQVLEEVKAVQAARGLKLKDFTVGLEESAKIKDIRARVEEWAGSFPMPGFDVTAL